VKDPWHKALVSLANSKISVVGNRRRTKLWIQKDFTGNTKGIFAPYLWCCDFPQLIQLSKYRTRGNRQCGDLFRRCNGQGKIFIIQATE
jgi:hypothetical protein